MKDILSGEKLLDKQLEDEEKNGQGDEAKKAGKRSSRPGPGPQLLKVLLLQHERCQLRVLCLDVRKISSIHPLIELINAVMNPPPDMPQLGGFLIHQAFVETMEREEESQHRETYSNNRRQCEKYVFLGSLVDEDRGEDNEHG